MFKIRWKARLLLSVAIGCMAVFSAIANAEISIKRDQYGVPDIWGKTNKEMFFAYGYSMARDRLVQITKLKMISSGFYPEDTAQHHGRRAAGLEYISYYLNEYPNLDESIKREIDMLNAGPSSDDDLASDALTCIAEGINQYLTDIEKKSTDDHPIQGACYEGVSHKNPGEILSFRQEITLEEVKHALGRLGAEAFTPNWTAADILKIFHNRVMDEFSNRNEEINSFSFLRLLEESNQDNPERARRMFNSFKWVADPDTVTEIPVPDGMKEATAHRIVDEYRDRIHRSFLENGSAGSCPSYSNPTDFDKKVSSSTVLKMAHREGYPQHASNFWATAGDWNSSGIKSVLFNGPQIGTLNPSGFYPFKMHSGEEFSYAGTSFAGTLTTFNGHNGKVASGFTASNADVSDVFCIEVERVDQDTFQGSGIKLIANPNLKGTYFVEGENWPVVLMDTHSDGNHAIAYIKRISWLGTTALSFKSFLAASQATNIENWNRALDTVGTHFNLVASSDEGWVSIRLTGAIPPRTHNVEGEIKPLQEIGDQPQRYLWGHDIRLPVPVSPRVGWHGGATEFHKLGRKTKNGYVQSWNHKPYLLMPDSDLYYDSWYKWDRAELINKVLEGNAGHWNLQAFKDLNAVLSRIDLNFNRFKPFLVRLEKSVERDDEQKEKLQTILTWSGKRENTEAKKTGACPDGQPFVPRGQVLFNLWYEQLANEFSTVMLEGSGRALDAIWKGRYAKLKQPKLNFKDPYMKMTYDTSQNIHILGKMMLINLKYAFGEHPSYDPTGWNFLLDRAAVADGSDVAETRERALQAMTQSLKKLPSGPLKACPTRHVFAANLNSGITMSSRAGELSIPYFRNRGAQNHVVEYSMDGIKSENVAAPGVRELHGDVFEHTDDQIPLFAVDHYRNMQGPRNRAYRRLNKILDHLQLK